MDLLQLFRDPELLGAMLHAGAAGDAVTGLPVETRIQSLSLAQIAVIECVAFKAQYFRDRDMLGAIRLTLGAQAASGAVGPSGHNRDRL